MTKRSPLSSDIFGDLLNNDLLGELFGTTKTRTSVSVGNGPTYRCNEDDVAMTISVDLPGVPREDAKVTAEGRRLTIEYQQRGSTKKQHFTVRDDYDLRSTSARLEHGVLELRVGRIDPPKAQKFAIEIK